MGARRVPLVLIPEEMAARFQRWASSWGWIDLKVDTTEDIFVVAAFSDKQAMKLPYVDLFQRGHFMASRTTVSNAGLWYRVDPVVHAWHYHALLRDLPVDPARLRQHVRQGWRQPPVDRPWLTLTFSATDDGPLWSAWSLRHDAAIPCRFAVVGGADPLAHLQGPWPVDELRRVTGALIGAGSIGGTVAETLAAAGVGRLALVDPDRLLPHNLARHRLTEAHLGRHKVLALRDELRGRHPGLEVEGLVADVAEDADLMRPLFARVDVVVCASDGVQSRRVANHLARRAGTPIVLVAVLEDGAWGELVRVRPRTGCLLCLRRTLSDDGLFDPEPGLDRDYGTGSPHRPMTAAPSDLRLMGELAGKAALATVLEARGRWSQRLPGDWAVVALQPTPEMPAPFDIDQAGGVRWRDMPNRRADCPSCRAP